MKNIRKVTEEIIWIGASDRRLHLFENMFPIPRGVSYNSYVLLDEKTVLLDTVDAAVAGQFFENLEAALDGKTLDYLVVNHMESDHCATIGEVVRRFPQVTLVGNAKTFAMIGQFFDFSLPEEQKLTVKEGDTLETGSHTLHFVMAPMVHWPEVMVTYDSKEKVLFAADAFGTFGALNGNLFADEVAFERDWLPDARRYYTNIVGKYGANVQALLKKAAGLEIAMICPLHGPVWRENPSWFMDKYQKWSTYEAEDQAVAIFYSSVYGDTASAVDALGGKLGEKGIRDIKIYDVSNTDISEMIAEMFRVSTIVLAATTYNAGVFPKMEYLLADMKALQVQKKKVALMENGSWAPMSGKKMREELEGMKEMEILEPSVTIKSAMKASQEAELDALADAIAGSL
ncbi:MAG: FprA family A-type flavoprotein [Lachnospiraceae bacterium]|nr:FprA family A-type flavoprotein [Lachnospiraceae bacterium]